MGYWDKSEYWKNQIKHNYLSGYVEQEDAAKAILEGTYDPETEYLYFKPKKGVSYVLPAMVNALMVELGVYDGPLPEILHCFTFKAGKNFNKPLPKIFSCVDFFCGDKFNQKLPKDFYCRKFSCDKSYNQPFHKNFWCDVFLCGDSFDQPLPEEFSCKKFFAQSKFNQPLPTNFKCENFHAGWRFDQDLPPRFTCEKFDCGNSFSQKFRSDFKCKKLTINQHYTKGLPPRLQQYVVNYELIIDRQYVNVEEEEKRMTILNIDDVYCIYHMVDNDGFCSGAIAKKKYPHANLIPFMYEPEMSYLDKIPDGSTVYIVDASLPMTNMRDLMGRCDVHWIDHHDIPIKASEQDPIVSRCPGIRKMEAEAACELTWQYLFPEEPVPPAVTALGRFDAWDQAYFPDVLIFDMWVKSQNVRLSDATMGFWMKLFSMSKEEVKEKIEYFRPVYMHDLAMSKISAKSICYEGTICGYKAIIANRSQIGSPYFSSVLRPDHVVMVAWHMRPNGRYKYTVYSNSSSIDVGKICEQFGGGGRKGVGGFFLDRPFIPNKELSTYVDLGYIDKSDPNIKITKVRMKQRLLRIEAPHYVAGAIFEQRNGDWFCVKAAPIIKWLKGKYLKELSNFLNKRQVGWKHQWID